MNFYVFTRLLGKWMLKLKFISCFIKTVAYSQKRSLQANFFTFRVPFWTCTKTHGLTSTKVWLGLFSLTYYSHLAWNKRTFGYCGAEYLIENVKKATSTLILQCYEIDSGCFSFSSWLCVADKYQDVAFEKAFSLPCLTSSLSLTMSPGWEVGKWCFWLLSRHPVRADCFPDSQEL